MNTPICDFVRRYADRGMLRMHMPGHKGLGETERLDLTEVAGADSLYEADGIIAESQENASRLFGCPTFYSTEGSSQCIRAMVYLAVMHARLHGKIPVIAAGRNAHKTFLSAVALMDAQVQWLYPAGQTGYLSCPVTDRDVETLGEEVTALYLTSPDYLGNMVDIAAISRVCRRRGILLMVDNAHGAYLRFLPESQHPADLGADLCCDSAHKTLPVLTGGAYLHICRPELLPYGADALAMFGSTSPSYLILQSLDRANAYLEAGYAQRLAEFTQRLASWKAALSQYRFCGDEPMKVTIQTKDYGYTGVQMADFLRQRGIECEFADPDYVVLMPTPEMGEEALQRLEQALRAIPAGEPICQEMPTFTGAERVCSPRQAMLSPWETLPVEACRGRVLAAATVGCPPAVPILVSGERIDENAIRCFQYYEISTCAVVKE